MCGWFVGHRGLSDGMAGAIRRRNSIRVLGLGWTLVQQSGIGFQSVACTGGGLMRLTIH
ncbi:hypothetical protein RISK_006136 [Rhodopirellula islandica]|uniref:Uncharacterized protein n=1 Tax=Rhodopirellula islandica TaxID=595434 RepID=A0A0J1B5F3_RHOIS|nr:hypothetical protein RISK_006136 [Rhodopirellula islandica]